ncbi:MAG: hypothetical protein GEU75_07565 [Dehalococcoidia bacterium]|nr:hypothetical protein [Dehalococcoidia bacterium]
MSQNDWEIIRGVRKDMSDYVLHCTKPRWDGNTGTVVSAYEVLKEILICGYLKPSFALSQYGIPTVRGSKPAVCFTEQPLQFFITLTEAALTTIRYTKFGIVMRKDDLFDYGGRPVIYSADSELPDIPDAMKFRWVGYDPRKLWTQTNPIDWTHEREWRVKADAEMNSKAMMGPHGEGMVPLLIPTTRPTIPTAPNNKSNRRFIVIVDTQARLQELREWVDELIPNLRARGPAYWRQYAESLQEEWSILSLEFVSKVLFVTKGGWGRLEDIYRARP